MIVQLCCLLSINYVKRKSVTRTIYVYLFVLSI